MGAQQMSKAAFITGITGQDGSYLAELLLGKGYKVHGLVRRASGSNTERIRHLLAHPRLQLHTGDLLDAHSIDRVFEAIRAEAPAVLEVYNLAAQSHVQVSFEMPVYSLEAGCQGTTNILEAIRKQKPFFTDIRFCQASTSEMFGRSPPPQNEDTPFHPLSPYAIGKLFSYWLTRNYREGYGLFACNTIGFNHESERRGELFVSRKVTQGVARITTGDSSPLELGNLDSCRDWGHAEDYVRAMWMVLQHDSPDDFVVATGQQHSVRQFVEVAFEEAGIAIAWEGDAARRVDTGEVVVRTNPKYLRPVEVNSLQGDASKIRNILGWEPSISFKCLVQRMVRHDMRLAAVQRAMDAAS